MYRLCLAKHSVSLFPYGSFWNYLDKPIRMITVNLAGQTTSNQFCVTNLILPHFIKTNSYLPNWCTFSFSLYIERILNKLGLSWAELSYSCDTKCSFKQFCWFDFVWLSLLSVIFNELYCIAICLLHKLIFIPALWLFRFLWVVHWAINSWDCTWELYFAFLIRLTLLLCTLVRYLL